MRDLIPWSAPLIMLGVLIGVIGCSRTPAPAAPKPLDMGDELVCFFSRAEQKGRTIVCGESFLMCEAIRAEEYDEGAEVGPCTTALVSVSVTRE